MVITEIGGTVGDIESQPFLEAARQVRHDLGRENVFFLHVSLVPYLAPSGELKTKPTQHSVAALRSIGITPDALILRCDRDVPEALKNKIALMCDVDIDGVISTPDAPSIYDIPKVLHREELDAYVVRRLNLPFRDVDWTEWDDLLRRVHEPHETVRIALVGKYVELSDAYLSVTEALRAGGFKHRAKVEMRWVASDDCESASRCRRRRSSDVHGVLIPGGFGIRGIEGKIGAIRYARARGLPVLGLCLGLQCIVIEAARSVGLAEANSAEFDPETPDPVISTMADQEDIVAGEADLGGTMRLGAYPAVLEPDSIVAQAYERHGGVRAPPAPLRGQQRLPRPDRRERPEVLRHLAGRPPGRVRRVPAGRASVLRRHPGAPGAEEPADPAAPAVRRRSSARPSTTRRASGCRWRSRSSRPTASSTDGTASARPIPEPATRG